MIYKGKFGFRSGTIYHVTSRGDRREPIFVNDDDRQALLKVLGAALARFDARGTQAQGQFLPLAQFPHKAFPL
jgi:hypothetical protein